ncbi:MAG: site-specific DNA-methyltransferase [Bacteroidales bacterium]|nr:site-specific DNA-methyltransferase [Bacteroidales bacterium]
MKLYTTLEQQLKKEPNFVTDNGELKKWVVLNKAQNFDEELIALLLQEPTLKEKFFKEIAGVTVFNQNLFVQFLEQKNYLNDSYTQYKNKVGLTIDGKYLKQRNEVALVWPFKDCILEGGQSREEEKREEIFFNEILAQDEITQLLEPKVLTNAKRIDKDGENPLDQFNRNENGTITDNLIIKGNNLLALHTLKKEFAGKVKLIYIDPPYNTGNDGFNYNDSFNKSTWLTFMKNRFVVAKELLSKDGAIFVQCDDNEQAYLKILMDEVFGKENYRETIVVKTSTPSGVNAVNVKRGERLFKVKEYILFYSKTPEYRFYPLYVKSSFNSNYRYEVIKNENGYIVNDLRQKFKDEKDFERYALTNFDNIYSLEKNNKKAGEKIKIEIDKSKNRKEVVEYVNTKGQLVLIYNGGVFIPLKERIISEESQNFFGTLISDLWDDEIFQTNQTEGGVSLPGGKKPEKLIKRILDLTTKENDLVLDYHLGSGTTAAVAHKMKRQYIGIEQLDYGENDSVVRLKKVIEGEQTGISKSINWQGGGSFVYLELKKYNQTFIEQIEEAKDTDALLQIWEQMKSKSFLNYNVDIKKQDEHLEEFKALSLAEQKQHLCELLDKNQLYVNLSSLNDADFACTAEEKKVTQNFYQIKK